LKILGFWQLSVDIFRRQNFTFGHYFQCLTAKHAKFVEFCRILYFAIYLRFLVVIVFYSRSLWFKENGKQKSPLCGEGVIAVPHLLIVMCYALTI